MDKSTTGTVRQDLIEFSYNSPFQCLNYVLTSSTNTDILTPKNIPETYSLFKDNLYHDQIFKKKKEMPLSEQNNLIPLNIFH